MEKKYLWQKFLLNQTDYENVRLRIYHVGRSVLKLEKYGVERNLFDGKNGFVRRLSLSQLDDEIDGEGDWEKFARECSSLNRLIIGVENLYENNSISYDYRICTMKAYAKRLADNGIPFALVMMAED